jgi:signal transduction histidine kinase
LLDAADGRLHLVQQSAQTAEAVRETAVLAPGEGLAGTIFSQNQPQVIVDLHQAAAARLASPLPPDERVVFVGVPMRAKGRGLGVLSIFCREDQDFSVEEVALLGSIADQVGIAVENARLYRQAEQLAVIEERQRLARELHDAVTQSLYSSTLLAEVAHRAAERGDLAMVAKQTARLGEIGQQALKEMRLLVYELRPLALRQEGLIGALQQRLDAVENRAGLAARLLVEEETAVPPHLEAPLYRIAQEALNNALKHAAATAVTVTIRSDDRHVALTIADNGRGFDVAAVDASGLGLRSMRERAATLGGGLTIGPAAAGGTVVAVTIPRKNSQPHLPIQEEQNE